MPPGVVGVEVVLGAYSPLSTALDRPCGTKTVPHLYRTRRALKPARPLAENVTVPVLVANVIAVTALALALAGYIYLAVPLALVAIVVPRFLR